MTNENSITPEVTSTEGASITFVDESAASKPFSDEQQAFLDNAANPTEEKLIFGKYKSMEEAEKAHKSLESGFHEKNQTNSDLPSDPQEDPVSDYVDLDGDEDEVSATEPDEALNKLTEVEYEEGTPEHNIQTVVNDYLETGEMTPELEQNFKDIGIPKELAERHRELMDYQQENQASEMFNLVGGQEKYQEIAAWADTNMPQREQDAFNEVMESGHIENIKSAILNLSARYSQVNNTPNHSNLIKADAVSSSHLGYESQAQMIADMSDPRYETDEAYRAKIYAKVERSNL